MMDKLSLPESTGILKVEEMKNRGDGIPPRTVEVVAMLDAATDFTADLEDPTIEELDEHLREEGIDPDTVVESVLSKCQEKLAQGG